MGKILEKTLILLEDGFEEIEALGTYDVLRRGGIEAQLVSVKENLRVRSSRGVTVEAVDILGNGSRFMDYDVLIIPEETLTRNYRKMRMYLILSGRLMRETSSLLQSAPDRWFWRRRASSKEEQAPAIPVLTTTCPTTEWRSILCALTEI